MFLLPKRSWQKGSSLKKILPTKPKARSKRAPEISTLNDTTPAHQLPVEILADIFDLALAGERYNIINTNDGPWLLSHVCQYWKHVALGTPYLWTDLNLELVIQKRPPLIAHILHLILGLSGTLPLNIRVRGTGSTEYYWDPGFCTSVKVLLEASDRWYNAELSGPMERVLADLVDSHFPILEGLSLIHWAPYRSKCVATLKPSALGNIMKNTPRLRAFVVHTALPTSHIFQIANHANALWGNLSEMTIDITGRDSRVLLTDGSCNPDLSNLPEVVSSIPAPREAWTTMIIIRDPDSNRKSTDPSTLDFTADEPEGMYLNREDLGTVVVPQITSLTLSFSACTPDNVQLSFFLAYCEFPSLQHLCLDIQCQALAPVDVLTPVIQLVRRSECIVTSFALRTTDPYGIDHFLIHLPHIQSLQLLDTHWCTEIMTSLSCIQPGADMLCMNLSTIEIRDPPSVNARAVLEMLQVRVSPRTRPIEKLVITGGYVEPRSVLKEYVDKGIVVFRKSDLISS
jgi:hypothetical protein